VRDEQACLNLNTSDAACWQQIPGIGTEWAAAVIDFTDQDNDTSPDGAESSVYLSLEPAYAAKNRPLIALKELLCVKGTTCNLYVGEDLNRNLLLDENETDGAEQPPVDNEDNKLDLGLVDIFTVHGEGRININTASKTVLAALPGLDEQVADAIIAHRCGPDGIVRTEDDIWMTDANDLAGLTQVTELHVELLQQYCCFSSQYLRVFSTASVEGGHTCSLMATVKISGQQSEIVCLERLL
jgi:DNA uptake protein ComE-like DNA-binding protein